MKDTNLKQRWEIYIRLITVRAVIGLLLSIIPNLIVYAVYQTNTISYNLMTTIMIVLTATIIVISVVPKFLVLMAYKYSRPREFKKIILSHFEPNLVITVTDKESGEQIPEVPVKYTKTGGNVWSKKHTFSDGTARFRVEEGDYDIKINSDNKGDYKMEERKEVRVGNERTNIAVELQKRH